MAHDAEKRVLLGEVLRDVSRSFYLTLRVLPGSIRDQIGVAYLLARATDTIADTNAVPVDERLAALRQLSARIADPHGPLDFQRFASGQSSPGEQILLQRVSSVLRILEAFRPSDQAEIRRVLATIVSGQEFDLLRFSRGTEANIIPLKQARELDDYTYRVAGCVGEFWTRICLSHLLPRPVIGETDLVEQGIRFGKGLQLVNILRDVPADLRSGRCYLPQEELEQIGLHPADLLLSQNEPKARPVYNRWLFLAKEHLQIGWRYVLNLPRSWVRLRLACAWPILIGIDTVHALERENVLDSAKRVKISRRRVKQIVRRSLFALPFKRRWEELPSGLSRSVNQVAR